MATGYTYPVEDGKVTDLRTFALGCARAFGATVHQREENMENPPRPREVYRYHEEQLKAANGKLAELLTMTVKQAAVLEEAERAQVDGYRRESAKDRATKRGRYEAMLEKVTEWKPPKLHAPLREFMLSQLRESFEFNGNDATYELMPPRDPAAWLAEHLARAQRDVEYHATEWANEQNRCKEANEWIAALYASLPVSP